MRAVAASRAVLLMVCAACVWTCVSANHSEQSRKVIGSSVVTSVSVIMDHGNGTKTYISDAAGQPLDLDQTDGAVGSPVDLLNPDRYEFYTFDETGDLVKKLMTLDEIKGLLAGGDGETIDKPLNSPTYFHSSLSSSHLDDSDLEPDMVQGVHSVVTNVQNVLRSELKASKVKPPSTKTPLNIPDSISSWSMLFPAIVSDAEVISDGIDNGNSVNSQIDIGDRLPAPSNIKSTEIKANTDDFLNTEKPTAVPPIIHFFEIQSVPSNKLTMIPIDNNISTTYITEETDTTMPSTTTEHNQSQVNSITEMSDSISNILAHMTNTTSTLEILSTESENGISMTTPSYSKNITNSFPNNSEEHDKIKTSSSKPDSSVTETAKKDLYSQNSDSNINNATEMGIDDNSKLKYSNTSKSGTKIDVSPQKLGDEEKIKMPSDIVVNYISTLKPLTTSDKVIVPIKDHINLTSSGVNNTKHSNIIISPVTAQSSVHTNKIYSINTTSFKDATTSHDKPEAHASEEILKIIPAKQVEPVVNNNHIKNSTVYKTKIGNNTSTIKFSSKPQNKESVNKPQNLEHAKNCSTNKKHTSISMQSYVETKNTGNDQIASSTYINDRVNSSKLPLPSADVKGDVKQNLKADKQSISKIKVTEHIKVTTYKPSTSQPFTTKQATNKISTTTEKSVVNMSIGSETKIHEVNSSLFDIKINKETIQDILNPSKKSKVNVTLNDMGSINESVELNDGLNQPSNEVINTNSSDNLNHTMETKCKHRPKPIKILSMISNGSNVTVGEAEDGKTEISHPAVMRNTTLDILEELTTQEMNDNTTNINEEYSSTESINNMITEFTTLSMPEADLVKEGISAVTNILLDFNPPLEPQLPLPTIPLAESASNIVQSPPVKGELKHASFDGLDTTTTNIINENVTLIYSNEEKHTQEYFTTALPINELLFATSDIIEGESETTSSTLAEGITENVTETSSPTNDYTTENTDEFELKEINEENKLAHLELAKNNQTLPTKESKLSNENESVEPPCNHTLISAQSNNTGNETNKNIIMNRTELEDNLKSAQSIIKEVTNINSINKLEQAVTSSELIDKMSHNSEKDNPDLKTGLKQDTLKLSPGKFPNIQSQLTKLHDRPVNPPSAVDLHPAPHENMGLEATTSFLADDVRRFSDLCNELAFRMWTSITGKGSISSRSLVLSPFATTSLLAMVFLGARGPTSGQMNDVLRLDDMVTFNPHQVLQNVTESVLNSRNYGVTTAAFVRELYSDKLKGKILDFYKERAQQYYDGHVEEISFNAIGDILRRRTNLLIKRQTLGKIPEYLRGSNLNLRPPLAAFSANIFQTDCDLASTEGRDGEMYFVVRPSSRQRRLVPVPAAVWRTGFLAGYEPGLDATAVALGTDSVVSTVLVLPGQQGQVAPGDGLVRLEQRLIETSYRRGGWTRLLRSLLPRPGLELQVPRFSHRSVLNVTSTLQRMGLKDLFNEQRADLRGLNGLSNDLHLSEMVQVNTFSTCGEDTVGARHHIETYPMSPQRMGREDLDLSSRPEDFEDPELFKVPLNLRPRQARLPDNPRLRFDRPFLYMVRHNPTGMILHMGRFNPRLLP